MPSEIIENEIQPAFDGAGIPAEASTPISDASATIPDEGDTNDVASSALAAEGLHLASPEVNAAVASVLNPPPKRHPIVDLQEILFGYQISLAVDAQGDKVGLRASKTMMNGDTHMVSEVLGVDDSPQKYADFASRAVNSLVSKGL